MPSFVKFVGNIAEKLGAANAPLRPDHVTQVRAEQVGILFRNTPIGITGALLAGILLGTIVLIVDPAMVTVAVLWLCTLAAAFAAHFALCLRYWRAAPPAEAWRFWARRFILVSGTEGIIWGVGSVLMISSGTLEREFAVMLVVSAVAACSAAAFGPFLPAFLIFMLPAMTPYFFWSPLQGDGLHLALAVLDLLFLVAVSGIGWRSSKGYEETLSLRFEVLDLVDDLRAQKRVAEEASVAKSRFLASASHDLRQPVHALSMFIGALQSRSMDEEARRILTHVERSVDALDGLFSALLDISKLDANVIEKQVVPFPIQPLLERIVADHAAMARAKGISLSLVPCSLVVESDPLLLERILRNMVSNAVRFTLTGRVLIGCRRGPRLRILVCDTGPGIPAGETQRIFEEFYQLANPERDRTKGLGLGLAIVNRLAHLLDCPVSVRSVVGRGSVFGVSVPVGAHLADPQLPVIPPSRAAHHGLVLVVDDETLIQEAMNDLLKSWGFATLVAGSGAEMLERIEASFEVPRLIICDYRLRGEESGIEVIRTLQSQYNDDIPGLLITGDTAPERIRESTESGFPLLHKPIAPARLQGAIDELLAVAEARLAEEDKEVGAEADPHRA